MKKNLFGAVAAGLALALAITSFGCESGNDDPIARPEFADLAAVKGSKFTYVATPTEWKYTAAVTNKNSASDGTKKGQVIKYDGSGELATNITGYTYDTYIDGVQNYNKVTAESWDKAKKSEPKVGDVINTKSETITLNAGDKTFTWSAASSAYEVRGIRLSAATAQLEADGYDTLPFYFASTGTAFAVDAAAPYYTGAVINTTTYDTEEKQWKAVEAIFGEEKTSGTILAAAADDVKAKQELWDTEWKGYTAQEQAAFNAKTDDEKKAVTKYGNLVAAKEAQTKVVNFKALVALYKEGARYSILDTATKAGATTGNITYYAQKDGKIDTSKVIKTVSKAGGTAKDTASGVYTISTNDYKNATITVTTYKSGSDTIVFNSDDTYTKNGELQYHKVDVDFPKATTRVVLSGTAAKGNKLQKAARVLTIAAGKLTAPRFISSYTNGITDDGALTPDNHVDNNGFLLSSSYTTYEAAYKDTVTTKTTTTDGTYDQAVSYSYVWK